MVAARERAVARCRHRGGRRNGCAFVNAVIDVCWGCGAWLSLGPSVDSAETEIEVRAAEIAAWAEGDCMGPIEMTNMEDVGWRWHCDDAPWALAEGNLAGWLAREIMTHDARDEDEA